MAKAIKDSGVKFTVSFPHKTWPTLKAAKELVDSGKLGQITYARVHNYHNGSVAHMPDGSLGLAAPPISTTPPRPRRRHDETLGAHPMYTLHWFLGEPKSIVSQFTKVTGRGRCEDNARVCHRV